MSFFSFNLVGNALDAYQQAENVTANNITNVATPGASRQSADVTEAAPIVGSPFYTSNTGQPGTQGEGAVVNQITRIHQDSYDGLFRGASSSQYYYTSEQQQLQNLQSNFGEPSNGVNSAYAALQTAVTNAAASPTSVAVRQAVLSQAQTFATALNSASTAISGQETSAIQQGASFVTQANTLIDQIATLNGQIRALSATGDNANTYLDQRDYAIDQLSQIVPTSTSLQANGSSLVSVNGRPLVNDTVAYHLAAPVIGTASNGAPTLVVGFANDKNPSNPTPIPLGSGQLGALTDVYNKKLVPYGQQLDDVASTAATEMNRITEAGVDLNNNAGSALFTPAAGTQSITAASISVAITDPTLVPLGLISTAAGSLTQAMNSADNIVSTSVAINGYGALSNPPPATGLTGTLTVAVDGITQTYSYNTAFSAAVPPVEPADTIGDFMTSFNAGHYGVTASYDAVTQTIAFARDPNNVDAVHRGLQGTNASTAGFTVTDSLTAASPAGQGTPAGNLLQALGAQGINGVPQTSANAFGVADNGAANGLLKLFSQNVGVGALQSSVGPAPSGGPYTATISPPAGNPTVFSAVPISVGSSYTFVNAATGTSQSDLVTAVSGGTFTVVSTAPISANDSVSVPTATTVGTVSHLTSGQATLTPPAAYPNAFVTLNVGTNVSIGGTSYSIAAVNRTTGAITVNAGGSVVSGAPVILPTTGVGAVSTGAPYTVTIPAPTGTPGAFSTIDVGQVLTIVNAASGTQQNVPVTAVNRTTGAITVTASEPINANDPITTAQTQTLGASYQGLVTQMAVDASNATTGVTTQTALASSIDSARQAVDGINIDEETQNLLKFQSAYEAAAKTLNTINTMMQTTLGLIASP